MNTWDGLAKKRVCQFRRFPTSISALDFNHDGSQLAIASSYTFEEGEKEYVAVAGHPWCAQLMTGIFFFFYAVTRRTRFLSTRAPTPKSSLRAHKT